MKIAVGKRIPGMFSLLSGMALIVAGCLKTPDLEYVSNKEGINTLISDHAAGVGEETIAEQAKAPKRAEGNCEKVNEYTSIKIKADVAVPEGNAVSVWQVEPRNITSEEVRQYVGFLYGDGEIRNISPNPVVSHSRSEEEIYELLETYTRWLDTAKVTEIEEPVFDEDGNAVEFNEEYKQELENSIESLTQELAQVSKGQQTEEPLKYDFAPDSVQFYLEEERYDYEYEVVAFTGRYQELQYNFAVFKDGYNTGLKFYMDPNEIMKNGYFRRQIYWDSSFAKMNMSRAEKTNSCRYSKDEAVAMCKEFLYGLGIVNMDVNGVQDLHLLDDNDNYLGNKGYQIFFYWNDETLKDAYSSDDMYFGYNALHDTTNLLTSQIANDVYRNEDRTTEKGFFLRTQHNVAVFTVLDDGIVGAWIQNPMENKEQLAENVRLLGFDQVLERGIAYLESSYGDFGTSLLTRFDIDITTIELNYARMQAPDSDREFIMVPVWDFKTGTNGDIEITVNAIDGSHFDREKGY